MKTVESLRSRPSRRTGRIREAAEKECDIHSGRENDEGAKKAMGNNILLNAFYATKRILVITDASGEGFGHIMMQKRNEDKVEKRAQAVNREGVITKDTGWVVIQVGSVVLKLTWRTYSALQLEATCVVWSLETLAY